MVRSSRNGAGSGSWGGETEKETKSSLTRLVVSYPSRLALIDSIIENIQPAGILVSTPFAAVVGTRFLLRISLEHEGESAEFPAIVVTSIAHGFHTLATTDMGMSLKIERTNEAQSAGLSKIFAHELDVKLGWAD